MRKTGRADAVCSKRRTNTIGGRSRPPISLRRGMAAILHHRFFELLGSPERDLLAGLDVNSLAGRRVAPLAGSAFAHHQDAEPTDADAVALLEMLGHQTDQIAEHGFCLLL